MTKKYILISIATFFTIFIGSILLIVLSQNASMNTTSNDNADVISLNDNNIEDDKIKGVNSGTYEAYSSEKLEMNSDKKQILFFHANWCPTCRILETYITSNLTEIPKDVVIYKVDYDSNTDLKRKYGITYQHTLVYVDSNGELIDKWAGSNNINEILENI